MRSRLVASIAALAGAIPFACGPSGGGGRPAAAPIASTSTSSSTAVDDGVSICQRVCAVQTKCGGDAAGCTQRCLPMARVLLPDVLEAILSCVAQKSPAKCDETADGIEARKHLIGQCTLDATQKHLDDARSTIDLFVKAYCARDGECTPASDAAECAGRGRAAIMGTEGDSSGGLYGSLRASKVDEIVTCMRGPCETHKTDAAEDLGRCLDDTLAKAAEPVP